MNLRPLLLASLLLAGAAHADPRITSRFYVPSQIVTVRGHAGIQSTIMFAPDERIENIAVGNSAAWQVTPNKRANLIFVKPSGSRARTNMTVITDQRTYLFDLVSSPAPSPVYMLRFTYPDPPKPVAVAAVADPVPEAAVTVASPPPPTPAELNFGWTTRGERRLAPIRMFDDGRSTYLAWPKDVTLPAILTLESNGLEGPVNSTVQGDYIVVEGVPAQLILRQGKLMATLTPNARPVRAEAPPPVPALGQVASARQ